MGVRNGRAEGDDELDHVLFAGLFVSPFLDIKKKVKEGERKERRKTRKEGEERTSYSAIIRSSNRFSPALTYASVFLLSRAPTLKT